MSDTPEKFFDTCMPSGKPAPYLMTHEELVEFLRIQVKFPRAAVERMRKVLGLKAVQVSRRVLFRLPDVLDFIEKSQERNPR
jgi:hypothetical protein